MEKQGSKRACRELIILGRGHTFQKCPKDGKIEIWGVQQSTEFRNVDRYFEIHSSRDINLDSLRKVKSEIITAVKHKGVESRLYPIEHVLRKFKTTYLGGTIACMIALAIFEGYKKIWFYGIDCPYHSIYALEKASIEYWIGVAKGAGVEIILSEGSNACRWFGNTSGLYGFWGDRTEKVGEISKRLQY